MASLHLIDNVDCNNALSDSKKRNSSEHLSTKVKNHISTDGLNRAEQLDRCLNELLKIYTVEECDHAITLINKAKSNKIQIEKNTTKSNENAHIEAVEKLIDSKVNVNLADASGNTPMHYASKCGNVKLIKRLIERGGDVSKRNNNLNTPIHNAARYGHTDLVYIFLENCVSINVINKSKNTPLHLACKYGHPQVVFLLLSRNANIKVKNKYNQIALDCAKSEDVYLEFVYRNLIDDVEKESLLFKSIENNWTGTFNKLMHLKVNINAIIKNDYLDSPIITAARYERAEFMKKLIDYGCEINYKNKNNIKALHILAHNGNHNLVRLLIKSNVNIEETGGMLEQTALHYAAYNGHIKIVEYLINHGANVCSIDNVLRTPLHYAALAGHGDILILLMQYGAISKNDQYGLTPLRIARNKGHNRAVQILLNVVTKT